MQEVNNLQRDIASSESNLLHTNLQPSPDCLMLCFTTALRQTLQLKFVL